MINSMRKKIKELNLEINNIFCIGRNYVAHIEELKNEIPSDPLIFTKPNSSVCFSGESLIIPSITKHVDYEVEMVLVVGKTAKNISEEMAQAYITHVGVGIDFTARDLQNIAKSKGLPWTLAKGLDTFCALGNFVPYDPAMMDLKNMDLSLQVNGELRQNSNTQKMIYNPFYLVSYLSKIFTLSPGDLIFTGTPEGVKQVFPGDKLEGNLGNRAKISLGVINS